MPSRARCAILRPMSSLDAGSDVDRRTRAQASRDLRRTHRRCHGLRERPAEGGRPTEGLKSLARAWSCWSLTPKSPRGPIFDYGESPDALVIYLIGGELALGFEDAETMLTSLRFAEETSRRIECGEPRPALTDACCYLHRTDGRVAGYAPWARWWLLKRVSACGGSPGRLAVVHSFDRGVARFAAVITMPLVACSISLLAGSVAQ